MKNLDLVERDPQGCNRHVKVNFEDVLSEPFGVHSLDITWECIYSCYTGSKDCCYATVTFLSGIFLALCWGCQFGLIVFYHVFFITPCIVLLADLLECCHGFIGNIAVCSLAPVMDTIAILFTNIRIERRKSRILYR